MPQKLQTVTIKGTKDGLVFLLDDECSFSELLAELKEKLSVNHDRIVSGPLMAVKLKTGNRYLSDYQKQQIRDMILKKKNLVVERIESNVITKAEAEQMAEEKKITSVTQMVRSGQYLQIRGDLLLVGDVNSGATVEATGSIYVMGALKGDAYAGSEGKEDAIIASSVLRPSHLRIADLVMSGSDLVHTDDQAKCAYVDGTSRSLVVDRIQSLYQIRKSLKTS